MLLFSSDDKIHVFDEEEPDPGFPKKETKDFYFSFKSGQYR